MDRVQMLGALYNCAAAIQMNNCATDKWARTEYAKGILVGQVSVLMDRGRTFYESLKYIHDLAKTTRTDMTLDHLEACLPETWKMDWKEIRDKS